MAHHLRDIDTSAAHRRALRRLARRGLAVIERHRNAHPTLARLACTFVPLAQQFIERCDNASKPRARKPATTTDVDLLAPELQSQLLARGHDIGAADGIIGTNTRRAIQAEQRRLGLVPQDGRAGQRILRALSAEKPLPAPEETPVPAPADTPEPPVD